jgi:hypothetical protein
VGVKTFEQDEEVQIFAGKGSNMQKMLESKDYSEEHRAV